uniref:CAZy families CBM6/GH43 protein n=1 Tax=uncultured Penicillium TaxID=292466 RepID=A0A060BV89_9EURO|nr:CAZy families CBM6/GH43 protein [uncultured Penicillium]
MNEDMISLKSSITPLDVRDRSAFGESFTEAPWVYKHNGMYYMVYASQFPESIHYTMSRHPSGPWKYQEW